MGLQIKAFQGQLNQFAEKELPERIKRITIEVFVYFFKRLRFYTPWRTGHAYANWRATINWPPPDDELGVRTERPPHTTAHAVSEQQLRNQLAAMKLGTAYRGHGADKIYAFNNVRYVQALEDGNSINPAKGHMVDLAIAETRSYMSLRNWY